MMRQTIQIEKIDNLPSRPVTCSKRRRKEFSTLCDAEIVLILFYWQALLNTPPQGLSLPPPSLSLSLIQASNMLEVYFYFSLALYRQNEAESLI